MIFNKQNLEELARGLERPFILHQVATLDHFAIYLYLARGEVGTHRHLTYDEMFYVVSGTLLIASTTNKVSLHAGELALVPRGVEHSSAAMQDTTVVIAQAKVDPDRKNGHGGAQPGQQKIAGFSPLQLDSNTPQPFFSVVLIQVDEMAVRTAWCQGVVGWHRHSEHDELLLVMDGELEVGTEAGTFTLARNELVVIPRRRVHRLSTLKQTLLLSMVHSDVSSSAQMGYAS